MRTWIIILLLLLVSLVLGFGWMDGWFTSQISVSHGGCAAQTANGNDPASVQAEIDDPGFRRCLAQAARVGEWRVRHKVIRVDSCIWSAPDGLN